MSIRSAGRGLCLLPLVFWLQIKYVQILIRLLLRFGVTLQLFSAVVNKVRRSGSVVHNRRLSFRTGSGPASFRSAIFFFICALPNIYVTSKQKYSNCQRSWTVWHSSSSPTSVHPSVTRRYSVETIIQYISSHFFHCRVAIHSSFSIPSSVAIFRWRPPNANGGIECKGYGKITDFTGQT